MTTKKNEEIPVQYRRSLQYKKDPEVRIGITEITRQNHSSLMSGLGAVLIGMLISGFGLIGGPATNYIFFVGLVFMGMGLGAIAGAMATLRLTVQ